MHTVSFSFKLKIYFVNSIFRCNLYNIHSVKSILREVKRTIFCVYTKWSNELLLCRLYEQFMASMNFACTGFNSAWEQLKNQSLLLCDENILKCILLIVSLCSNQSINLKNLPLLTVSCFILLNLLRENEER